MKKAIPIGEPDYRSLRTEDFYTVDKSMMIQDFLVRKSKVTLITRPRRFGKTLNMSMMAEFFDITKDSKDIFEGTAIMKTQYAKEMNQYPTIFLSFAECKGEYKAMKKKLFEAIRLEYARYQELFESIDSNKDIVVQVKEVFQNIRMGNDLVSIDTAIKTLSQFLNDIYKTKVMVFIDEYDTPFIEAQVNGFYNEIRGFLSSLLHSALKDNKNIKLAMLTGIQRVAKENIFSDLNNLDVYSVEDKEYAPYFGFTTEETKDLLEYYDLELNDAIKTMYDGYNMGGLGMYNPWSILSYAKRKELIPYWVNTSGNTMIKEAIKQCDEEFNEDYEKLLQDGYVEVCANLQTSFFETKQNDNLWGLFVNAGYLTIAEEIDSRNHVYLLKIPNDEVINEFKDLVAFHLHVQSQELSQLYQGIKENSSEKFFKSYQKLLLSNPSYHDLKDENSYHMLLLGICLYLKEEYEIMSNREEGLGRCDIVLKAKEKRLPSYVIEFKYTKETTDLQVLATKAITQIIEQKYDAELVGKVIYIGLAHHGKEVEIDWQER